MRCPGFPSDDYAFHALEQLGGPESEAVEEHLEAGCETCLAEMNQARALWFSVATATVTTEPPRRLRRKVLQLVGGRSRWGAVSIWQPWVAVPVAGALALAFSAGLGIGRIRNLPEPALTFAPVYSTPLPQDAPLSASPAPITPVAPPVVVKQTPDPAQAALIATLHTDLDSERRRSGQLELDLARQQALAATAREAAQEAERRLLASAPTSRETAELRAQLASLTTRAGELDRQVKQYRLLLEIQQKRLDQTAQIAGMVSDPSLRVLRLRATEKDHAVLAQALTDGSELVFSASHLPPLPANRTYQLWVVRAAGDPVASAGTFAPDASQRAVLQVRNPALLSGVTAMAVTDEPAGGSARPTGHKWLIGT